MKDDDDQEDASSSAVNRYPCMPSLVALQQMRNRLHLAFVGKKLMKWTAQATGRELRKLAMDLIRSCQYGVAMKDAFILLARARYFYPNLNKMVLEHIGYAANIKIDISTKSISGVKVLHMEVIDNGQDTYQHLGIDKGGQAILEAKVAWRKMVRDVIRFLEQREAFQLLDLAHRSATKKKNVLVKIIIPKLKRTIKFILTELEEVEREEVFRLKRFKQIKMRKEKKTDAHVCCCCLSMLTQEGEVETTCPACKKAAKGTKSTGKYTQLRPTFMPTKRAEPQEGDNMTLLDHLVSHIDGVIDLAKQYKLEGIVPATIDKFIKVCSQIKDTVEDYANTPRCDLCNKTLEATSSGVQLAFKTPSSKSVCVPPAPKMTDKMPPSTESCFNLSAENDDKLGYFENKFKEIVKVTRLKNEDGTVHVEKQVITIRTERRIPGKNGAPDSKAIGPGGPGGGGGQGGRQNFGGGTDYGGDGGPDFSCGPRETKSECTNRGHQMGEPKLRSCMSASHSKSAMNKDASNFDSSSSIKNSNVTLPDNTEKTCHPLPKVSKASSIDSVCCPRTASVCGSQLESGPPSLKSMTDKLDNIAPAQTCMKKIPVQKPMKDQSSYALDDDDDQTHRCHKSKLKTTSANAVWRDAKTSSTDIDTEPSGTPNQGPSRPTSKPCIRISTPGSNSSSEDSVGEKPQESGHCCIKIIPKPPKEKPKEKEPYLPGSLFETIKSIFLPPSRSNESCKVDPNPPKVPAATKNICSDCQSKISTSAKPSTISESPSCKMCQTTEPPEIKDLSKICQSKSICSPSAHPSVESQSSACKMCQACMPQEESKCPSCRSTAQASSSSISCKSLGVGSSTHVCMPSTPSLHSQKHTCCLEKKSKTSDEDEDESTCCAMAQTNKSSKSICCSKKKTSSVCCPGKSPSSSVKSTKSASGSCTAKTDATTCTKRSARFDVRPLRRHTCEKIDLTACTCRSDPNANRHTGRKPLKRSQSFYEDDYYFFKW